MQIHPKIRTGGLDTAIRCGDPPRQILIGLTVPSVNFLVLPDQNSVIVLTESTEKAHMTLDLLWKYVVPGLTMTIESAGNAQADRELSKRLAELNIYDEYTINRSPLERMMNGKTFEIENNHESLSTEFEIALMNTPIYGIEAVKLIFAGDVCGFSYFSGGHESVIRIGLDGQYRTSVSQLGSCMQQVKAKGNWTYENVFQFVLRPVESPQSNKVTMHFLADLLEMSWFDVTGEVKTVHQVKGTSS